MPLFYFSMALLGGVLFIARNKEYKSLYHVPFIQSVLKMLWIVAVILIFSFNLVLSNKFLERLDITGGEGLYSDAINKFSMEILERDKDSMVYFPDWGYRMPFTFLTKGLVEYDALVNPFEMFSNACADRASYVVFDGDNNDEKFKLLKKMSNVESFSKVQWRQRNGKIAFEAGKFSGKLNCKGTHPLQEPIGQVSVFPSILYRCDFLDRVTARVSWNFRAEGLTNVSIYVSEGGKSRTLWTSGVSVGAKNTGPWAKAGMEFIFLETQTGKLLDSVSIENISCPMTERQDVGLWARPRKK